MNYCTVILLLLSQVFSILKTHLHTAMNYKIVSLLLLSQVFSFLKTHLYTAMNYSDFIVTIPGV